MLPRRSVFWLVTAIVAACVIALLMPNSDHFLLLINVVTSLSVLYIVVSIPLIAILKLTQIKKRDENKQHLIKMLLSPLVLAFILIFFLDTVRRTLSY